LGHKTSGGTIMPQTIRCPRVGLLISSWLPCINTRYM
jgi:hypothetical protein